MDLRDALERAVWTAVESGLAVLVITDLTTLKASCVAALAALVAAAKSFAKSKLADS